MGAILLSIMSLLFSIALFLLGVGLLGTVLGIRATLAEFPDLATGAVMSAYFAGFVVGSFLCPTIIRRIGHIRTFAVLASIASAAAVGHALWLSPLSWALLRAITGICMVGLYMVVESWLNVLAPNRLRGQIFSIYIAVTLLAMALGQFLVLATELTTFLPFGLVSIFFSLALVPVSMTRVVQPEPVAAPALGLAQLWAQSPLGVVGAVAAGLAGGAFWGMTPVFGQRIGLSELGIALFMSVTILGGMVLQLPIGHLSDRWDRRWVLTLVCLGAVASLLLVAPLQPGERWLPLTGAFLFGGTMFSVYSLVVAHVNDQLTPAEVLEATRGLLLLYGSGAAAGPLLAGSAMGWFGARALIPFFGLTLLLLALYSAWRTWRGAPVVEHTPFVAVVRTSPAALELDPRVDREPELDLR